MILNSLFTLKLWMQQSGRWNHIQHSLGNGVRAMKQKCLLNSLFVHGIDPFAEDVMVEAAYRPVPCFIVFIPAGCLEPTQNGFRVRDPQGCGVQAELQFPPTPNDPSSQTVDLSGELLPLEIRLVEQLPASCFLKIEAVFASNSPVPCLLPLQGAAREVRLQIGNDSGSVGITRIEFEGSG